MTSSSSQTDYDVKTGLKVTIGFFVMSLVMLVLASFLFEADGEFALLPLTEELEPDQAEAPETAQAEMTETADPEPAVSQDDVPEPARSETAVSQLKGLEPAKPQSPGGPGEVSEPTPPLVDAIRDIPAFFSATDTDLYRRIFALQRQGKFAEAEKIAGRLDNKLLMGHVLAQRLQRQTRPSKSELKKWLHKYTDHPDYGRIKQLARSTNRRGSKKLRPPSIPHNTLIAAPRPDPPYATKKNLTRNQRLRVSRIKRTARIWLRRGQISRTERLLRRPYVVKLFDRYEMDEARGMIAAGWFYYGNDREAYGTAAKVIARSGKALPMTHWIAGLAAWRMGKTEQALHHFETLATAPDLSGWISAGAALWAARAHTKLGRDPAARRWLEETAKHPYTLYGVLALNALGRDLPFEARHHPLTAAKLKLLASTRGGRRALALSEVGEKMLAEQELLALKEWKRPGMKEALHAVADRLQLPSLALRLTRHEVANDDDGRAGEPLDPAIYPIPPWKPGAKSGIDRALLFAIMRQESDFNSYAHSPVGALGLMQLMPDTARMLNRGRRPFRGARRLDKYDPEINVKFGERYLTHLRTHKRVRNDLIKVIAAYNSGPGNIGYWARKRIKHDEDPLLFIEAIPNLETRLFVRRVLANLWIYRHLLGQNAPSLEAIVAGRFPRYRPIDGKRSRIKRRNRTAEIPRHPDG